MSLFAIHYVYDHRAAEREQMRPVHRAWIMSLVEAGVAKAFSRYEDAGDPGALLIFEAESADAIEQMLTADPYQQAGLVVSHSVRAWPAGGPWVA
ncbi:YciI family protein [Demequina silvatica]|uniref:YciI family protein n=1 Tax=Demequina silvatica TaxID=1638988 RepID=UPI000784E746|nr:YciI family protein [Demequina silvatica]